MQTFIDHARILGEQIAACPEERERFGRLASGQSPQALFITCSDSRLIPSLITGAQPGELFELRTAGNVVPGHRAEQPSGEAATIEYAVSVLRVPDIIVCGHSYCGAVGTRVRGEDLSATPAVAAWLESQLPDSLGEFTDKDDLEVAAAAQRNVREQLERLRGHPCVAERLAVGQLRLHGWFYALDTGLVLAHQPSVDVFLPL